MGYLSKTPHQCSHVRFVEGNPDGRNLCGCTQPTGHEGPHFNHTLEYFKWNDRQGVYVNNEDDYDTIMDRHSGGWWKKNKTRGVRHG